MTRRPPETVNAWEAEAIFMEVEFDCIFAHYTLDKTTTLSCLDLLHQGNRSVEIPLWIAEQAPRCKRQRVAFAMIYLEDGDGNILSGLLLPGV